MVLINYYDFWWKKERKIEENAFAKLVNISKKYIIFMTVKCVLNTWYPVGYIFYFNY